jgi:hypothetical protein
VHLLAGLLFLSLLLLFIVRVRTLGFDEGPMASMLLFVSYLFAIMAALGLSSSIGLWRGAQWGWWIAAFYYVWAILGVTADLAIAVTITRLDGSPLAASLVVAWLVKLAQLVILALILAYLWKRNVRLFYRLESLRIGPAMIRLAVIAIVLLAGSYFVTFSQFPRRF